jgi:hypothetical protein
LSSKDRDATDTTYTSSVKGRTKQVLPQWRQKNEPLRRQENINLKDQVIGSFGQGRLSPLVEGEQSPHIKAMEARVNSHKAEQQSRIEEAAQAQALVALPQIAQDFFHLKKALALHVGLTTQEAINGRRNSTAALIRMVDHCLENTVDDMLVSELVELCEDKSRSAFLDISKKNKDKLKKRKHQLAELKRKVGL